MPTARGPKSVCCIPSPPHDCIRVCLSTSTSTADAASYPLYPHPALTADEVKGRFRQGLFDPSVLADYASQYAKSEPYKHAVIHDLFDDRLLRSVRDEIRTNVSFTPKETDIYKIHQSGDLANLDGLDDGSLAKLPSLLALRDAVYSESFRHYVSHITGCGPLSGKKTDMAVNVYTPGCYLLCHDDVIGSRRVSYILYLTDPDVPWQPQWGGALRLYPVIEIKGDNGEVAKLPQPDFVKSIPPAWNQLSFFAVQPGQSFHDVEEVYHATTRQQLDKDGGRVRMAISGWFHIPQVGEDGYIEGEEERNAENSSLVQLQGNPAQHDTPHARTVNVETLQTAGGGDDFEAADLEFLLKYISPTYLTPNTLDQISDHFETNSTITLTDILSLKFAEKLKEYVTAQDKQPLPEASSEIEEKSPWQVSKPPHKHRYLYQHPTASDQLRTSQEESPLTELLDVLLPSRQFRHWLQLATRCTVESHDILARRFRRGKDYALATGHEGKLRLEVNLGITPSPGWGDAEDGNEDGDQDGDEDNDEADEARTPAEDGRGNGSRSSAKSKGKAKVTEGQASKDDEVGGHEIYMAGDDDAGEDAAVYKASSNDDNILFFQAAAWNKMTIVLRDSGALRFVKYVSKKAQGDRWDVSAIFNVPDEDVDAKSREDGDDEDANGVSESDDDAVSDSLRSSDGESD